MILVGDDGSYSISRAGKILLFFLGTLLIGFICYNALKLPTEKKMDTWETKPNGQKIGCTIKNNEKVTCTLYDAYLKKLKSGSFRLKTPFFAELVCDDNTCKVQAIDNE